MVGVGSRVDLPALASAGLELLAASPSLRCQFLDLRAQQGTVTATLGVQLTPADDLRDRADVDTEDLGGLGVGEADGHIGVVPTRSLVQSSAKIDNIRTLRVERRTYGAKGRSLCPQI